MNRRISNLAMDPQNASCRVLCIAAWIAAVVFHLFGGVALPEAIAQGRTEIIALSGQAAPDGNGTFSSFGDPALGASGEAAFFATLTDTSEGIFRGAGGAVTQVARRGQAAPDGNGTFLIFGDPALGASGEAAFFATLTGTSGATNDNEGIFSGTGGAVTQIAREGQAAPDGNGTFASFGDPALGASGEAAFVARHTGTSGGSSDDRGIFRGTGGAVTQIAREGQAAPDGNGTFSTIFFDPALNASGEAAFYASLTGATPGTDTGIFGGTGGAVTQIARAGQAAPDGNGTFSGFNNDLALNDSGQAAFVASVAGIQGNFGGIFRGTGGALTQIVRDGQAAPDGNGVFSFLVVPSLGASGEVAFSANLTGTSGGESDDEGIFLGTGGAVTQIVRDGQAAPDGNGTFTSLSFSSPALGASGEAAFSALLTGTSGGTNDDRGIFLANGIDTLQLARKGDTLAGSTITGLFINASTGVNGDERSGVNDATQVVYRATLASGDEAIVRFTIPDLRWTAAGSGDWTTDANWTESIEPSNSFHDTTIDPATSLTVTAPTANTTVKSFTLGGGTGVATLRLGGASTGDLRAIQSATIADTGVLHLTDGRVFSAPSLDNSGVIRGSGTVDAVVSNSNRIESIDEELAFSKLVTNNASTGLITGRNAILRFNGGLTNDGALAISFGTSDVFGDVTNGATGTIAVASNGEETINVTFYDDVANNGTLNVVSGSTAVFIGALSGNGNVGGGNVHALGDLQPGASPGLMEFGGSLTLGPLTNLDMELGGLAPGSEFDQLAVAGDAALAGALTVSLIDGFALSAGDSFEIVRIDGARSGAFAGLAEGAVLGSFGGLDLVLTYAAGDGNDVALFVPGLPGDYNENGIVDAADYTTWRDRLGSLTALPNDDTAGVGLDDYTRWKTHFGQTNGSGSGATAHLALGDSAGANYAVPEPSSWLLLLTSLLLGCKRRNHWSG
jgi:hypothetical protein